jgi:hypothetical protein
MSSTTSTVIRTAGMLWAALFAMIAIACVIMRYFLPLGWPSAVPLPVRFILGVVYIAVNFGLGLNAAQVNARRQHVAAWRLGPAILIFTALMFVCTVRLGEHAGGHTWQALLQPVTMGAALICAVLGSVVLVAGVIMRGQHPDQPKTDDLPGM